MHFRINVQIDWDINTEDRREVFARLRKVFSRFRAAFPESSQPKDGIGWANFESTDETLIPRIMAWLDKEGEKYQLVQNDCWTVDEMVRARWLELLYLSGPVDIDHSIGPLNHYRVLCEACGRLDISVVPEPYKILDDVLRKDFDFFRGDNSLIIFKAWVKDLLRDLVADQMEWGETCVVNSVGKAVSFKKARNNFLWVRPKHCIGQDLRDKATSRCSKCKQVRTCKTDRDREGKLFTGRFLVKHFGKKDLHIARVANCMGPNGVVVSGGLWGHLYNSGVKGLVLPDQGLYSAKGEPPPGSQAPVCQSENRKRGSGPSLKMWWEKRK
ncbi:MAG: hypothetical protein ACJ8FY_28280 [Gemmataceae bacterium]